MHTPEYDKIIPVAATSDIVLDTQLKFLRFQRAIEQSIDDALHYVVSHPAAHLIGMARRRLQRCKDTSFSAITKEKSIEKIQKLRK